MEKRMSIEIKEELKERVLKFIEAQPGYDADQVEEITVKYNHMDTWSIVYGESMALGIAGIGDSPEDAFDDFVIKWRFFKGFEWIRKTKMLASMG
jgi:hypothetical protein